MSVRVHPTLVPVSGAAVLVLVAVLAGLPRPAAAGAQDDRIGQAELEWLTAKIRGEVEELRALEFKRPVTVAVTDRKGFLEYALLRLEETSSHAETEALEVSAKLLGLLPADMDYMQTTLDLLEEQVGGFYDPSSEAFYLMSTFTGGLARIILAHELTHALDDQHFDIDGTLAACKGNSDAAFAYHSVVEGSGTAVMNAWTLRHAGELDRDELEEAATLGQEELAKAPPYLWKPLMGAYLRGASFLSRTQDVMQGQLSLPKMADIDRAFRRPPRSSEQILHPEKYWDAATLDPPVSIVAHAAELPGDWRLLHTDTMGELGFALMLEVPEDRWGLDVQEILSIEYTDLASEGWGGDRYVLLGREDARVVISLSVWDTEDDAVEFLEVVGELADHLSGAAAAYAEEIGIEGAFFDVRRSAPARSVLTISAAGVAEENLAELIAAVEFAVAQPK